MGQEAQEQKVPRQNGQDEITRLQQELAQEHERTLRALADFDNYRRRVEREQANTSKRERQVLLLALLELADDFERALIHMKDASPSVSKGLQALQRRLEQILSAQGVTPFASVGQPFDPTRHEAIGTVQSEQHAAGMVGEEVRRGYSIGDDVLRPAYVRVVQANG
jgi:molecular chaperone GrpE